MSKVKIIDRHSEKSIKSEREFLSKLHHPFIVNMNCAFQDYENLYLVMDLLTGGDLRYHVCRIRKFTEEETKFFISCLLLGLEYIHNNNIIHRDIKPENLVCDENGYIRITDFGVAKINKEDNSSETSGTPGYMAPEVLMGQNHSFTVDFFAIGVMGYEFMIGTRPYNGKNRKEIKHMILKKQAKIDEDEVEWSVESVDFINKCLRRKNSKRLGYNDGVKELKNHKWFDGFDWEGLYNKSILAPFVPKKEGNYDKKYCEMVEKCGDETLERYNTYLKRKNFVNLFDGYTYVNLDLVQNSSDTYTRFTTNSKQNKQTNANTNYSNKKEIIKNNNFINNKNKNINKNAKLIVNNFNNANLNLNLHSPIMNLHNFFSGFKNVNKPVMPEIVTPINYQEIKINNNNNNNNEKNKKENENTNNNEINKDLSTNDINHKQKEKNLVKSLSIRSLINSPPKGRKLKLDKNSSFLNLKGEINIFNNNIQNNNPNDTNLSSLLSSNSIVNFNYVSKINSRNNNHPSYTREKKNIRSSSIEHSTSNINFQSNISIFDRTQKNNKIQNSKSNNQSGHKNEKISAKINKLCYNFSCKDLIGSTSDRNQAFSHRNKSNLKIKFKDDNSFNSSLLSPRSKKDENSKNKKISFKTNREFINKNKNYIQLRQINMENSKNIFPFYLPNLNKINNNNKIYNAYCEEKKRKGKVNLSNLYNFLKSKRIKKDKKEKFFLINDKKKNNLKMKRSGSTLQFDSRINLEQKKNSFINKNNRNIETGKKDNTFINNQNNDLKEKGLRKNASLIF